MTPEELKSQFLRAASEWVCDGYSADIRYVERHDLSAPGLWEAQFALLPLPPVDDRGFFVDTPQISAGHIQTANAKRSDLLDQLNLAANGTLPVPGKNLHFPESATRSYYSQLLQSEQWYSPLHLQVSASLPQSQMRPDFSNIDTYLRRASPPFDGFTDLATWLDMKDRMLANSGPVINLHIGPPVDLIIDQCTLNNNHLHLRIHAHPNLERKHLSLAIRGFPGKGVRTRNQVADLIRWDSESEHTLYGSLDIDLEHADSVLTMLVMGGATVRRNWFLDPAKARNHRLVAMQLFDTDLRKLKQAVLDPSDPRRFEKGIAALLFLLGYSASLPLETDAPDLVVATPAGRLVVVECTTRISDFHTKIGKLVDRRGALSAALASSAHPSTVAAVLFCALRRSQIAVDEGELTQHQVLLLSRDDIEPLLTKINFPADPDTLLDTAIYALKTKAMPSMD